MELIPALRLEVFNGWLLAGFFYLVFGVLLLLLPGPVVSRLYDRSYRSDSRLVRRVPGLLLFLAWLLVSALTPLRRGHAVFAVGIGLYGLGLAGFVAAVLNFASAAAGQPATSGLYRVSRHPQQFMISVSFLGISIAMGSWIAFLLISVGIVAAHHKVLAEERACLQRYGESYRIYMDQIPRYFLWF